MLDVKTFATLGMVVGLLACSSNSGVDSNSGVGATGNSGTVGGSGVAGNANAGANTNGGSAAAAGIGATAGTAATAGTGANTGVGGSTSACGAAVCEANSCGDIIDACGNTVSCGYTNCPVSSCVNNTCQTACVPITDCSSTGKDCGPVPDGCNGFIDCGTCPTGQCCGCGGVASVCGDATNGGGPGSGLTATCIIGTKGCLCDTTGQCASGLTCTPQTGGLPNKCCNGTDCAQSTTNIAATCPATQTTTPCTPGVTILTPSGTNDSCGYASSTFNENILVCAIDALGGGAKPAEIHAFYNDEHALALGCATTGYPVSAMPADPGVVYFPQTGDPRCTDTLKRPMRPSLFITDTTNDPNCKAGDQQSGGQAYDPVGVFGSWKSATMNATTFYGTPVSADPSPINYWNLGTGADDATNAINTCHCTNANDNCGSGRTGRAFGAEVRYEAGLIPGHSYRLQVIMHDGDQTQGGDAAESCVTFCAGGGCTPLTCADYPAGICGQQPDGCGGLTPECNSCVCPKNSYETAPKCVQVTSGGHPLCQTNYDQNTGYVLSCNQPDGCGGLIPCWCIIG